MSRSSTRGASSVRRSGKVVVRSPDGREIDIRNFKKASQSPPTAPIPPASPGLMHNRSQRASIWTESETDKMKRLKGETAKKEEGKEKEEESKGTEAKRKAENEESKVARFREDDEQLEKAKDAIARGQGCDSTQIQFSSPSRLPHPTASSHPLPCPPTQSVLATPPRSGHIANSSVPLSSAAPVSSQGKGRGLNANALVFVPTVRQSAKVTMKSPDGREIDVDELKKASPNPPTMATLPASLGLTHTGMQGANVPTESASDKLKRLETATKEKEHAKEDITSRIAPSHAPRPSGSQSVNIKDGVSMERGNFGSFGQGDE